MSDKIESGALYLTPRGRILFVVEVLHIDTTGAAVRVVLPEGRAEELLVPYYDWKKLDG